MPRLRVIYESKGAAREYAAKAVTLYRGCGHGCIYCYVPGVLRMTRADWAAMDATPRKGILENLEHDCQILELEGCHDEIMLCFMANPYHPGDTTVTGKALDIIGRHGLNATVLTKGGLRANMDFDLFKKYRFRFGSSIVSLEEAYCEVLEPRAASVNSSRRAAILQAHEMGIKTWVSLEPVINPEHALSVIRQTHSIVDHYMIGKINHSADLGKGVDWVKFRLDATELLDSLGASYTFKKSLS